MPNCAVSDRCISLVSLYRYARFAPLSDLLLSLMLNCAVSDLAVALMPLIANAGLRRFGSLHFACIAVSLCPICAVLGLAVALMPICAVPHIAVSLMPNCAVSYRCISLVSLYRYARFAPFRIWRWG